MRGCKNYETMIVFRVFFLEKKLIFRSNKVFRLKIYNKLGRDITSHTKIG